MKNSILQLIGQKQNILLTYDQACQVESVFSDGDIPDDFVIRLQNPSMSFKKGAIRTIEVAEDGSKKEENEKKFQDFYEQERQRRREYLSWPKERLASNTNVFEGLYKISSGKSATLEDIEKAKEVQLIFFRENPNRTLCDLYLLKPLIPMKVSRIDRWQSGFFRLAEKAVFRDMQLSGQFKKQIPIPVPLEPKENESVEDMKNRAEVNREMDKKFNDMVASALDNF